MGSLCTDAVVTFLFFTSS